MDRKNYFEHFGLQPAYFLDAAMLRKKYYEQSRELHPDLMGGSGISQGEVQDLSAFNNKAYHTLLDNGLRLKYLLDLFAGSEDANHHPGAEFLMEMMDLNEEVEDAVAAMDEGRMQALAKKTEALAEEEEAIARPYLEQFDEGQMDSAVMDVLGQYYARLKYYKRLRDHLQRREPEL